MSKKKGRSGHPGGIRCPDCGRRSVRQQLVHDPTCPAAQAVEAIVAGDADWFASRPDAEHRCRWITAAERMEMPTMADREISEKSVIHVARIGPGVRARSLYVPGEDRIPAGVIGLFGHPSTFTLIERDKGALPRTRRAALPSGLQVQMFTLPAGVNASGFLADVDGLVVLLPGDALPVPFA
ncbi:hypothetical protein ACN27G_01045 [Plantactinospora sp. WMMB334]|uniref:hypothetical protein n=1 Tax=Plantactinospora sp. WMMB334 TaxID=3404119 RepID=UPI003B9467DC